MRQGKAPRVLPHPSETHKNTQKTHGRARTTLKKSHLIRLLSGAMETGSFTIRQPENMWTAASHPEASKVRRETRVRKGYRASREQQVRQDREVSKANRDHRESRDCRARTEHKDHRGHKVKPDRWDHLDRKENRDRRVYPDREENREYLDRKVTPESQDKKENPARMV